MTPLGTRRFRTTTRDRAPRDAHERAIPPPRAPLAAEHVDHSAEVEPALVAAALGDISDPDVIGRLARQPTIHGALAPLVKATAATAPLAPVGPLRARQTHQACQTSPRATKISNSSSRYACTCQAPTVFQLYS